MAGTSQQLYRALNITSFGPNSSLTWNPGLASGQANILISTQVIASQGVEYEIDETTGVITFFNRSQNTLSDVEGYATHQHTVEFKPDVTPDVIAGPGTPIANETASGIVEAPLPAGEDIDASPARRVPFDSALGLVNTLGAAGISFDAVNTGRFTLNLSGFYIIRAHATFADDTTEQPSFELIQDPVTTAVVLEGTAQQMTAGDPDEAFTFLGERVIPIDSAVAAALRTFEYRLTSAGATIISGTAAQAPGQICGNLVIQKL